MSTIQNGEGVEAYQAAWVILCGRLQRDPATSEESDTCTLRAAMKAMVAFAASRQSLAREPATADVERGTLANPSTFGKPSFGFDETREASVERHNDWFKRNANYRDPKAFIRTDPTYFASECAAAINNGGLSRAAPSSEPAIAEGEPTDEMKEAGAKAIWNERQMRKPVADRNPFPTGTGNPQLPWRMQAAACWRAMSALAQSSTPPASKGVAPEIIVWMNEAIERAKKHGSTEGIWLFGSQWREVVEALSPTPSNDTLQGRGEVGA